MATKMAGKKKILEAVVAHLNKKIEDPEKQYKVKDFFVDFCDMKEDGCWAAGFFTEKNPKIMVMCYHNHTENLNWFVVYKQWSGVKMV